MHLIASVLTAAAEEKAPLPMLPIGFALVAFGVFLLLGVITWTYRDVANRHSDKTQGGASDHTHGAGH
jgi:hypothetical protein